MPQLGCSFAAENFPGKQSSHFEASASLYVPGEQPLQTAASLPLYFPAEHVLQEEEPTPLYFPAEHEAQELSEGAPGKLLLFPCVQLKQCEESEASMLPSPYFPAPQRSQEEDEVVLLYFPESQKVQA